jgi:hypothetical protein
MTIRSYLLSLPERVLRSTLGLGAGVAREVGEIALPDGVRRTQLYRHLVDTTLRFLIEQVGGAEGVYRDGETLADDFLARRAAGNAVEVLGIVAFRASPVWVLAALSDLCGTGRYLIPQIADALQAEGLLGRDTQFTSMDQLLDGLERTSARAAETINAPPLDVAALRQEWEALRREAGALPSARLPSTETVRGLWNQLAAEAARQDRTLFETSSMLALSAVRGVPEGARWLSSSALVGATRTGHVFAGALLAHYRRTLDDLHEVGYVTYATRQVRPYVNAALAQFSPERRTLTDRVLDWRAARRARRSTP